jgi:hypothetical protein
MSTYHRSHISLMIKQLCDVATESHWQWCCRVMLMTVLSSPASDGAAEVTWVRHDIEAESC